MSTRLVLVGSLVSGTWRAVTTSTSAASGTLMKKTQRHDAAEMR